MWRRAWPTLCAMALGASAARYDSIPRGGADDLGGPGDAALADSGVAAAGSSSVAASGGNIAGEGGRR
eukprot:CAMPEP_0170318678 /NCGR_PEP_ID=MMETSP0116_2-20130129/60041_1 /TAXON_ID=400756 /ORGANISM="Durinskia baltica, Strain CSIRO CS-38" /LENGTH=67 /DNA_ID=CAMNT_0010571385 /DNA_START=1 /DNA_END=200 /DNA_ORIENTATION=+